jgi:hypothetical protein
MSDGLGMGIALKEMALGLGMCVGLRTSMNNGTEKICWIVENGAGWRNLGCGLIL